MTFHYLKLTGSKLFLFIFLTVGTFSASAQQTITPDADKNVIKMNLGGLLLNNYSFQYERLISRKITIGGSFRFMPKSKIPWLNSFESLIDDDETFDQLKGVRISHTSFAPEVRFYFGKHDGPRGFYVAPFLRYSNYNLDFKDFTYEVAYAQGDDVFYRDGSIAMKGSINAFTGGFLLGSQYRIGKRFYLDWWILGISYGTASGKLTGKADLGPEEQDALRDALDELELDPVKTTANVDANGARLDLKGPWGGIRAGLSVGINF